MASAPKLSNENHYFFPDKQWVLEITYDPKTMKGYNLNTTIRNLFNTTKYMAIIIKKVNRWETNAIPDAMANFHYKPSLCDFIKSSLLMNSNLYINTTHLVVNTFDLHHNFFPFFMVYDIANICLSNHHPTNRFQADMAFFHEKWIQSLEQQNIYFQINDYIFDNGTISRLDNVVL